MGIGDNFHANTVATKAERAAAQARAAELEAMRAHKAKAQEEADATYAGLVSVHARLRWTDSSNPFRWARRLDANRFAKLRDLEQR